VHCCNTDTSGCVFVRGESDVRSMLCYSQCECLCHFFVFEKGGELDHAEYYSDTLAHVEYNSDSPACHCEKFEIQFQFHGGRERSPRLHCIFTVYPWAICGFWEFPKASILIISQPQKSSNKLAPLHHSRPTALIHFSTHPINRHLFT
jgi:hypothetical protein